MVVKIVKNLFFLRCVEGDKCKRNSIDLRSSFGNLLTPAALAETASCSKDSEVCCHELDIILPCTDYDADGYKCSETCFDMNQDLPKEGERNSSVDSRYYNPKNTFCPRQGHVCCKNPKPPPKPTCDTDKSKCQVRFLLITIENQIILHIYQK